MDRAEECVRVIKINALISREKRDIKRNIREEKDIS